MALLVLVIAALAHRFELIKVISLFSVLGVAFLFALISLVGGALAMWSLWREGGSGWGSVSLALVFGSIALAPGVISVVLAATLPYLSDISTDRVDPPRLERGNIDSDVLLHKKWAMQQASYPDIVSRRFRITPMELLAAVLEVVEGAGWKIINEGAEFREDAEIGADGALRVGAQARSFLFGFTDDIVIRIRPDPLGALLDVRSASRVGEHDLGANARRIRLFLSELDMVLLEAYGALEPVSENETLAVSSSKDETVTSGESGAKTRSVPPMPRLKPL